MVRTYRLSRGEAIARTAYAIAWILGLVCAAIFVFDGLITRIVILLFASLLFQGLLSEVFEATFDDEGVCEFRSLLGRKRVRAHQVRSIAGGPSDDPEEGCDIRIRYDGGSVSLPGEDFLGLVGDILTLNPAVKLDGWFRLRVEPSPSDRDQRIERIAHVVAFLGLWFFLSGVILEFSPLVLAKPLALPLAAGIGGGVAVCAVWLLPRSKSFKR